MKDVVISALCAVLLSNGAVAFAAPSYRVDATVVLVADSPADFATQRDEYLRKAQDEFHAWQQRMSDWSAEAKAKGHDVGQQARANLDRAWSDVQVDWRKLQDSAPSTWDKARVAFDEASRRLKSAWQKIQPEG